MEVVRGSLRPHWPQLHLCFILSLLPKHTGCVPFIFCKTPPRSVLHSTCHTISLRIFCQQRKVELLLIHVKMASMKAARLMILSTRSNLRICEGLKLRQDRLRTESIHQELMTTFQWCFSAALCCYEGCFLAFQYPMGPGRGQVYSLQVSSSRLSRYS
jgi:hypothetical protein